LLNGWLLLKEKFQEECWAGGIKVNENWRKRNNKELMQLFGDLNLDILSFVRKSRLNWIGHINRMDSKIKVTQILNSNAQGRRLRGQQNGWWNRYRQILINAILRIGRRSQKTELTTEVHKGGEGAHWTVVPLKEEKKKKKKMKKKKKKKCC
jgi:hypothetical protein